MLPPAMTEVTAMIIMTRPILSLKVNFSPKIVIPKHIAVTGSNAPNMAVGVEPIYWMALVVHKKEIAVGKMANANIFPHRYHWLVDGIFSFSPIRNLKINRDSPKSRT